MIHSPALRSFGQTPALRLALGLGFVLAAAIFISAGLSSVPPETTGVAIGVVILVAYGILWYLMGKTVLTLHTEGVRRVSALGSRELLWNEIGEYRYREIPVQTGGLVGGLVGMAVQAAIEAKTGKKAKSLQLTLKGRSGGSLKVTSNFKDADQAITRILNQVHDQMRPAARQRLDNHGEVAFGPLVLARQGVSWKQKEMIPWTEIKSCEISRRKLRIRRKGKMLDSVGVASESIPNVLLAVELLDRMRGAADTSGIASTFS